MHKVRKKHIRYVDMKKVLCHERSKQMEIITKGYSLTPPGFMRPDAGECVEPGDNINDMPIGMAYVPRQVWKDKYENDKALMRGTLFAQLDLPFRGAGR